MLIFQVLLVATPCVDIASVVFVVAFSGVANASVLIARVDVTGVAIAYVTTEDVDIYTAVTITGVASAGVDNACVATVADVYTVGNNIAGVPIAGVATAEMQLSATYCSYQPNIADMS